MGDFSIKDIEQITGIKAHTIRIWEKRYGILSPRRTTTNIRYYADDDLKKVLNLAVLNRAGKKISQLAKFTDDELFQLTKKALQFNESSENNIDSLILSTLAYDEYGIKTVLNTSTNATNFETTLSNLIFPFLRRIGTEWQTGVLSPVQEHFASNIIREVMLSEINKHTVSNYNNDAIVFFLPENEYHEFSLIAYNYMARKKGYATVYLGQSTPIKILKSLPSDLKIKSFFTSITTRITPDYINKVIGSIGQTIQDHDVFVTGKCFEHLEIAHPDNFHIIHRHDEYINRFLCN